MSDEVVGLGAWCDVVPDPTRASPGSASFDVEEFAVLADGRRVLLHHGERGFGLSGPQTRTGGPIGDLTAAEIESGVPATVLPDEDDGEEHPWEWLADLLRAHGVVVSADSLRSVPYRVELSERLQRLLAGRPEHRDG